MSAIAYRPATVSVPKRVLAQWSGTWEDNRLELTGPCPVCEHPTPATVPLRTTTLETFNPQQPPSVTAGLACACDTAHKGRPAGTARGCGRAWAAVATAHDDRTVTLTPAKDPKQNEAAQALREDRAGQLDRLRAAAEKWIPAVAALLGLIGIAGVTVGKDTVGKLSTEGRIGVAAAVAVAIAAGALAIIGVYRAAFGWPRSSELKTDEQVLDWYRRRKKQPESTGTWLRVGVFAAGVSVLALAVAGGLTWFLPPSTSDGGFVSVSLRDDSKVCGTLLSSGADGVLRVRRADSGKVDTLTAGDVVRLTVVDDC